MPRDNNELAHTIDPGRCPDGRCRAIFFGDGLAPDLHGPTVPPMFIRATRTGTSKDGSPRLTHRLVENHREDGKVRQRTRLNLGRHFAVERKAWPLLCERIEELLSGQPSLSLEPLPPEAEARRITARLLERRSGETAGEDWETVDVGSARDMDGRTLGVEHAAWPGDAGPWRPA